jgi:hypothetical protein
MPAGPSAGPDRLSPATFKTSLRAWQAQWKAQRAAGPGFLAKQA